MGSWALRGCFAHISFGCLTLLSRLRIEDVLQEYCPPVHLPSTKDDINKRLHAYPRAIRPKLSRCYHYQYLRPSNSTCVLVHMSYVIQLHVHRDCYLIR